MTNQRKSMRFIGCLLTVFMLAVVFCLPALADSASSNTYTIPDTNMTVTIPEGATVLSVDTPAGDAAWSKAGILDASEKIKEMQKNGTTAEIVAANGDTIAVAAKSSDYANSVFNLNNLDEKGKKDFLKYMEPSSMDGSTTGTITWYDHAQIPFFMIDICAENIKEEGPVYERLYGTLYDGKIVSFDLFGDTKEISEETDAFMRAVVDSAVISAFAEAPTIENGLSRQSAVTLGAVGVLIVLLIVYFVTTHSRNKREKQLRKETADRLAEYRRSKQDDESVGTGALRFVNETDHDDAAIKTFANYQAYHLQIFMPVFTVVLSVIALYVVWQLGNSTATGGSCYCLSALRFTAFISLRRLPPTRQRCLCAPTVSCVTAAPRTISTMATSASRVYRLLTCTRISRSAACMRRMNISICILARAIRTLSARTALSRETPMRSAPL